MNSIDVATPVATTTRRMPDAPGYWARNVDSQIDWIRVEETDELGLCVYVDLLRMFRPVAELSTPLTKWYGPIELPWDPE